jgi:hypothetical protein
MVLLLAVAGCTQMAPVLPVMSSPTPVPTTVQVSMPVDSVTPGPTGTLPGYWNVNVQVSSNGQAINPQIVITFRGGMGMNLISRLEIRVTRSDGIIETGEMIQPLNIGQTITLPGTTGYQDRAEVWAITPQGDAVKILDQYVPFRSYNS